MSAKGTRGFLLKLMDGSYVIRVYAENKEDFVDYDIHHYDLYIEIVGDDAAFFNDGKRNWIDYED